MNTEAPIGPVETALAEIWLDVLDLDQISRHDNFFALGGHSLQAVYMLERMRQQGFHGDLRALFAAPVLCQFAAVFNKDAPVTAIAKVARVTSASAAWDAF